MTRREGYGQKSRKARAEDKILPFFLGDANQFFFLVTFKMAPSFHHICHIYVCNMLRKGVPRAPTNKTIARTSHSSNISPDQLTPNSSVIILQQKLVLLVRSPFQVRVNQFDRRYDVEIPKLSRQDPFVSEISAVAYNGVYGPIYVDAPSVTE